MNGGELWIVFSYWLPWLESDIGCTDPGSGSAASKDSMWAVAAGCGVDGSFRSDAAARKPLLGGTLLLLLSHSREGSGRELFLAIGRKVF
jgi:hypothetical protein